jgi:ferritin-like metal-binding protein YciE
MPAENLHDLLVEQLKDLYSAETQLTKALPRMAKKAQDIELRTAFQKHLNETEQHVARIEQVCELLGAKPRGKKCVGMEGLIEEGKEEMEEISDRDVLDAAMIGAAQKVEHYEIAAYGTARTHARRLGYAEAANILQQTLEEEAAADEKLTRIAESGVNAEAVQGSTMRGNGFSE